MSSDVKAQVVWLPDGFGGGEHAEVCRAADYAALEAECERLREELAALRQPVAGEREAFELFAALQGWDMGMFTPPSDGEYRLPGVQKAWEGWRLARAALSAPAAGQTVGALVEALEMARGFLANQGYPSSDPLVLGAIDKALAAHKAGGDQ